MEPTPNGQPEKITPAAPAKKMILYAAIVAIVAAIVVLQHFNASGKINVRAGSADIPASLAANTAGGSCTGGVCVSSTTPAVLASSSTIASAVSAGYLTPQQKASKYPRAKEIVAPSGFINSPVYDPATNGSSTAPFKIADLIGKKVILVDFWTYSCINCQRTIPYLEQWYSKYKDQGLEIVAIHTPEFKFEEDYDNVTQAVKQYGIKYPVVLDNDHGTWSAYANLYWPHEYLIDIDGYIVHDHIGEGDYDGSEKEIQYLLNEKLLREGSKEKVNMSLVTEAPDQTVTTPETYFGSARNEYLFNASIGKAGLQMPQYTDAQLASAQLNQLYMSGDWNFHSEYAESQSASKIGYKVIAKKVFMVASSATGKPIAVDVYLDGKIKRTVTVKDPQLYTLIDDGNGNNPQTLELKINDVGLQAYTFTFGS